MSSGPRGLTGPPSGPVEAQLRAEMRACTTGIRLPGHLLPAARRQHRMRRARVIAALTAATVGAAAAAAVAIGQVAVPAGRPTPRPGTQRLAAYVLRQAGAGLARQGNTILESAGTGPHGVSWVSLSDQQTGQRSFVQLSPAGRPVAAHSSVRTGRTERGVSIDYLTRTWWVSWSPDDDAPAVPGGLLPATTAQLRDELAAGTLTVTGHQWIGGTDTLRVLLTGHSSALDGRLEMWLDPASYLPVRAALAGPGPVAGFHEELSWLPATAANRARLTVSPPPGFTRLAHPPATPAGIG